MDVGFIGLGHMGAPMARNLLKGGHRVTVYNRTRGKAEALAREGAQVAERVADACRGDVLITMLGDDAAVEGVVFGEDGLLRRLIAHFVQDFFDWRGRRRGFRAVPFVDRVEEIVGRIIRQPDLALIVLPDQRLGRQIDRH